MNDTLRHAKIEPTNCLYCEVPITENDEIDDANEEKADEAFETYMDQHGINPADERQITLILERQNDEQMKTETYSNFENFSQFYNLLTLEQGKLLPEEDWMR